MTRRQWLAGTAATLPGVAFGAGSRRGWAQPAPPRLPPDATTHHVLQRPGGALAFTAVAGALHVAQPDGKPVAEVAFVAYGLDGVDPRTRPVTFVTNGGPGAASAWLHLGALGPWRIRLDDAARAPSAAPDIVDNADTWLDFTDLVFLDPPGTGWSRLASDDEGLRRSVWSVDGDVAVLAEAIRRWLDANGRFASPKFFAGESYAGLRGPRLARALAEDGGIGLAGLVLISPFMDGGLRDAALPVLDLATLLPSMAAIAHGLAPDSPTSNSLGEVEAYATGAYLDDLLRGERDGAAIDRLTARVADYTGLSPALVRRHRGRINRAVFLREHAPGSVLSAYDATMAMPDPFPEPVASAAPDPTFAQFGPPLTNAIVDLLTHRLGWHADARYVLSNDRVSREWDWGHGLARPESLSALRVALAADPGFRVLVGHGIFDLVTPYLGSRLLLAQLPDDAAPPRVHLALHAGGHMFYTRDASRAALHDEACALMMGQ